MAILAGFLIGIGGAVFLSVGGPVGAFLFAVGLMTICHYKLELFTGKISGLVTGEINISELLRIWCGNFVGTMVAALMICGTPRYESLVGEAAAIIQVRLTNGPVANLILGVFCGLLMYVAVNGYATSGKLAFVFVPVAVFILAGFNHCVADMFYLNLAAMNISDYAVLIPTTIGNVIGGVLLPGVKNYYSNC